MRARPTDDPRWQKLMARGGVITVPFAAPDVWPHGPIPAGEKTLERGEDSLSASYCTVQGHRFVRALLLLPIREARTVFGFETWASVSEESWRDWLAARAGGEAFGGCFAWLANALPGVETGDAPVPCNLEAGPPGQLPRLQPRPDTTPGKLQTTGLDAQALMAITTADGRSIEDLLGR